MRIVICISLAGMMLLGGLAFGTVLNATHTGSYKLSDHSAMTPSGVPEIVYGFSGDKVKFIQNRDTIMTGASQSAGSIRHWDLTTLPADPNMPFPPYLIGGDMVRVNNENRSLGDYQLRIETDRPSYVYLVMENRVNGTAAEYTDPNDPNDFKSIYSDPTLSGITSWVANNGWVRMNTGNNHTAQQPTAPDFVGNDEGPNGLLDQYAAIYRHATAPIPGNPLGFHFITLGAQGLGNMYAVIVQPAPSLADLTKNGVVDVSDMIAFVGQWLNGAGGTNDLGNYLAHRYTFNEGAGTTITDVVGGANGTLYDVDDPDVTGTQTFSAWGTGYLDLLNVTDVQRDTLYRGGAYIQLPSNMVNALRNDNGLTFEIFFERPTPTATYPLNEDSWRGHYFCFGQGNNPTANDEFSLISRNNDNHVLYWHQDGGYYDQWYETAPKLAGNTHAAVVVNNAANTVKIYVNGVLKNTADKSAEPWGMPGMNATDGTFNDVLNFLGRGYGNDSMARVRYKTFNIYDVALTDAQVTLSYNAGADKVPCIQNYTADLDKDCDVDLQDFAKLAEVWLMSYLD